MWAVASCWAPGTVTVLYSLCQAVNVEGARGGPGVGGHPACSLSHSYPISLVGL